MKAKIIRLAKDKNSSELADDCITQAKKFNLLVEKFDALDGEEATEFFAKENISRLNMKMRDTPGLRGCVASHIILWKECVRHNVPYLILEHDGYMIRELPNIESHQFDVIKLDNKNPYDEHYSTDVETNYDNELISYSSKVTKKGPYGGYGIGAYCYIVTPIGAKKLVEAVHTNGWLKPDTQLGMKLLDIKTFNNSIFRLHPKFHWLNIKSLSMTR